MTERFYSPVIKYTTSNLTSLPGALLYFYETGTSTPKTTWTDPERDTASAHPVVALSDGTFPPIFINGVYRVELKNAAGVTQPGWPVDDVGAPAAGFPFQNWSSTYSYSEDDLVTYNGEFYQSLDDDNIGNTPSTATAFWQKKLFLDAPTAESYLNGNADGTYTWRTIAQTKSDLSLPTDTVSELALKAPIASPTFTGNPTAPTPSANDNDTSIATTAYVQAELLDRVQTVATIAALTASTGMGDGQRFNVTGYNSGWAATVRGPTGGGEFVWDATSVVAENLVTVFESDAGGTGRFLRVYKNEISIMDGGAVGDFVADDTIELQRVLNVGVNVRGDSGFNFKTTDTLFVTSSNVTIDFGGSQITNKADSLYAICLVTDNLAAQTESDLIDILTTLNYGDEIYGSSIKNLTVEMSAISSGGSNLGVGIVYGKNCTLENINVTMTNGNGIELRNSTNCGVIRADLTPRLYGLFNFMTKDCYAAYVNISGCDRGIITKMSQGGDPVNFTAYKCKVSDLTNTLYYTVGGEFKERDLTDEIYEFGHEIVKGVTYHLCDFTSSSATVKLDLSFWASEFKYIGCTIYSGAGSAGTNIGLNGNQLTAKSGTVNTSGATVTYVSGDNFAGQTTGTSITINSVVYTILSRTSDTVVELTSSAGTQSGVAYSIAADVQQKNHKFVGCTFTCSSTTGAVALAIGADTQLTANTFDGTFQRLIRAEQEYGAIVECKNNTISGVYQGAAILEHAPLSSESGGTLICSDNTINLTTTSGTGTFSLVSYNAASFNNNDVRVFGSDTYSAYPVVVSDGYAKNNKINVNGFDDIDAITITADAVVTSNDINHDATSTGTANAIRASSGSTQVREIANNVFSSGWDANESYVLTNNQQYPEYADQAAAATGSLSVGRRFRTAAGVVLIKL